MALTNDIAADAVGANGYGGRIEQTFRYDGLHRLVHAEGTWDEPGPSENGYTLDLQYDVIHNLVHKTQSNVVTTPGGAEVTQRATTYDWAYQYTSGGGLPHAPSMVGSRHYEYDAGGRLVASYPDGRGPTRTILWDSEDRVRFIQDGGETVRDADGNVVAGRGRTTEFVYDATGQRVFKRSAQGETAYVNQFYTLRNGTVATKHVFVGTTRETSKLVPGEANTLPTETDQLARVLGRWWEHRSEEGWEHAQNVEMNPHYRVPTEIPSPMGLPESNFIYFYHPDHLGSTSFVTDGGGELYEHVEYFPHGEVWAAERSNTERIPYLFSGKELDQETGLYDFGSRMYDPRVGLWISPDPALPHYIPNPGQLMVELPGMGGVFNPLNLNGLSYAHQNPIRLVDPNGEVVETAWDVINVIAGAAGLSANLAAGNWVGAGLDAIGLLYDLAATAVPGLPAGAGAVRNSARVLAQARRMSVLLGRAIRRAPPSLRPGLRLLRSKLDDAIAIARRGADEAEELVHSVYREVSATGEVLYVGITNNFARRAAEHLAARGFNIQRLMRGLSRSDAHAVEQVLIEMHGFATRGRGGSLLNEINSIARRNPAYYARLQRGIELLRSIGYRIP